MKIMRGVWLHGPLIVVDRFLLGGAIAMVMAAGAGLIAAFYHGHERMSLLRKFVPYMPPPSARSLRTAGQGIQRCCGRPGLGVCGRGVSQIIFLTGIIALPLAIRQIGGGGGAAESDYFLSFVSQNAVAAAVRLPRLIARLGGQQILALEFVRCSTIC